MMHTATDAQLVRRVLDGDVEAFGVLVDRYQDEFVTYAAHILGSGDEAADVVQESLVRAYRSLGRCKDPDRFKGWLFRIVSNRCKTHLARRRGRRAEPLADATHVAADAETPDEAAEAREFRERVLRALGELSPDHREALVLKYVHGLSLEEMTEVLGASVSAVKMRLQRGRNALRAVLEGEVS